MSLPASLVRFGFRLLYNELAWTYDAVSYAVSLGQWREWTRAGLPFLQGPHVLELGHGPGHLQVALREAGFRPVGLDLSAFMGRMARVRAPALVRARAEALPFPAGAFDSVLSTFPTVYIAEPATLAGVARVLRPGGRLVVVPEAMLSGGGAAGRLIDWLYVLTGQRSAGGETSWITILQERMSAAGFETAAHTVVLPASRVTVVVGEKRKYADNAD